MSWGGCAGTICAQRQDAIPAVSSSPRAQTAPNSVSRCLRLAFQHMAQRLLGRRIMSRTAESSRQARSPIGSAGLFVLLARVQMRIRRGPTGAVERMGVTFWECHSTDIWPLTGTRATRWGQSPWFGGPHCVADQDLLLSRKLGKKKKKNSPQESLVYFSFIGSFLETMDITGSLDLWQIWWGDYSTWPEVIKKVQRLQSVAETDCSKHSGLNSHQTQLYDQSVSSRFQPVVEPSVQKPWLDPLCGGESCNWPHRGVPCIHCFPKFKRLSTGLGDCKHGITAAGRSSGNRIEPEATWKSNQIQSVTFCLECAQRSRACDSHQTWTLELEDMKVTAMETLFEAFSKVYSSLFAPPFSGHLAFALWLAHYRRARAAAGQCDDTRRVVENGHSDERRLLLGISAGLTTSLDKFKALREKRTSK